jgi:predicted secreted protein
MAGASRDIVINKNSTRIAGINSKTFNVGKSPIDITSDEDSGYRTFLDSAAGSKTIDVDFSGIIKDDVLSDIAFDGSASNYFTDIELVFENGDTITGDFYFDGFSRSGGGSDGAVEFSGTLQSSGPWTFTPSV